METDIEGRASMVIVTAAVTTFSGALAVERRDTVLIAGAERRCDVFSSVAHWPMETNAALGGVIQSSLATPMEADGEASTEAETTLGAEMDRQLGGEISNLGDEGSLLESALREKLINSMRSKPLVRPKQQHIKTTARDHELGLETSRMDGEAGATRPLISKAEVEEVRVAARRAPGPDNQGAPMETDSEERASMVIVTVAATTLGEALAFERRDTELIAGVDRCCNDFSSEALWPTCGVMQSSLGIKTPMDTDGDAAFVEAEIKFAVEMGRQLRGDIFDIGDEGSLLESVLREKLIKSMRPRLPVAETTARDTERGFGTSTANWMENEEGATMQLISAAAVEDVLEAARRVQDNHGEPRETESEESQAGSGTLVAAGRIEQQHARQLWFKPANTKRVAWSN